MRLFVPAAEGMGASPLHPDSVNQASCCRLLSISWFVTCLWGGQQGITRPSTQN